MKDLNSQLANKVVFQELPTSELETLAEYGIRRQLADGEFLCFQGDFWPNVIFLQSGRLRWVMLSAAGKEHQLFALEPDEIFWAHSMFDDQPMPASLMSVGKTETILWHRDTIYPILMRHPEAMWQITGMLTKIMRQAREIIYGLAFQPVAGRLANFILENQKDPSNPSLERDMTLEEIATVLATSPEVVCRLLYQFQKDGVVKITRTRITIEDQNTLSKLAQAD